VARAEPVRRPRQAPPGTELGACGDRPHFLETYSAEPLSGSAVTSLAVGVPGSAGFPCGDAGPKVGATKGHDPDK
jgi:hypothetical protein